MQETLNILIIDDDEVDRMTVIRSLKTAGIVSSVIQAETAANGLQALKTNSFDCLFIDFKLPDMDGLQLLREIRKENADVPVLLITSYGDERIAAEAIKIGASDYISKSLLTPEGVSHSLRSAIKLNQVEKQKKAAESNLQHIQQQLHTVIENTPIILWAINTEGIFEFSYGKGLELLNIEQHELTGKSIFEVFSRAPALLSKIRLALAGEISKATNQLGDYYFESLYQPTRNEAGIITGITGLSFDITARIKAEETLKEARDLAEESIRIKEQFFTNMSHEIRTPMNGIIGLTGVLQKTSLNEEQKTYLDAIATSADRLLTIINDLLDFSKIEAGKISLEEANFNLRKLMAETTGILELSAKARNNRLKVIIDAEVPEEITGDQVRLNQILTNLIGNAIKFTENGQIRVLIDKISETDQTVKLEFEIQDSGIGIPEEKLQTVFESFTQASSDTTRKFGGTGLGLTISKQLIELQGGKLNVRSKLNEGSTFSFTLEFRKPESAAVKATVESEIDPQELGELHILLAEDNEINQLLARKIITDWGFKLDIAPNGRVAVDLLKENNYDLVLMDMQMPEMDGYEAITYIREKMGAKSSIPIIAFTAHATKMEIGKCLMAGANSYVSKPLKPEQLLSEIYDLITDGPGIIFKPDSDQEQEQQHPADITDVEINLSFLKEMASGNESFMEEVIGLFISSTPESLAKMQEALHQENWDTVKAIAHRLKSNIFLLGISELDLNMSAIEQFAQRPEDRFQITNLLNRTQKICTLAIDKLRNERFSLN